MSEVKRESKYRVSVKPQLLGEGFVMNGSRSTHVTKDADSTENEITRRTEHDTIIAALQAARAFLDECIIDAEDDH